MDFSNFFYKSIKPEWEQLIKFKYIAYYLNRTYVDYNGVKSFIVKLYHDVVREVED
jgi:hypothetical protein